MNDLASIIRRVFAFVIDSLVLKSPLLVYTSMWLFTGAEYWQSNYTAYFFLISQIVSLVYFLFKDALFNGQSIGKYILKIKTIDENKTSCSIQKSFLRNFLFIIPLFSILELFVLIFSKNGKRIGDYIASTLVVNSKKATKITKKRRNLSLIFIIILFCGMTFVGVLFAVLGSQEISDEFDRYIYLIPVDKISQLELSEAQAILNYRLSFSGYPFPTTELKDGQIIIRASDLIVQDRIQLEEIFNTSEFKALIGEKVVFRGGEDIEYVCRRAECAGIDTEYGCGQLQDGTWSCGFRFSISLSPEAAQRQAEATSNLEVVLEGSNSYLNESLDLYLDDELVDTLNIDASLKGTPITEISISGGGNGFTEEEAVADTLNNMNKLQVILATPSLPVKFTISKII